MSIARPSIEKIADAFNGIPLNYISEGIRSAILFEAELVKAKAKQSTEDRSKVEDDEKIPTIEEIIQLVDEGIYR